MSKLKWAKNNKGSVVITDGNIYVGFIYMPVNINSINLNGFLAMTDVEIKELGIDKITEWKDIEEMSEFEFGEEIWVSQNGIAHCQKSDIGRYLFAGMTSDNKYIAEWQNNETGESGVIAYEFAISAPIAVDYTLDTFPRGLIYIRRRGSHYIYIITGLNKIGISFDDTTCVNWDVLSSHEISTDLCKTWQKAVNHE